MLFHRTLALFLCAVLVGGCSSYGTQSAMNPRGDSAARHRASSSPIQHIVIIMQENRSFDNFFYKYPGANYATQGNGHDGRVYPLLPLKLAWGHDQNHYHWQFLEDSDKGKNDGFEDQIIQPYNLGKGCTAGNWFNEPHCWHFDTDPHDIVQPYTYTIQAQIQPYWDMAKQYVLGDKTFSSNNGPTFVSHQYLIAAQSSHASEVPSTNEPKGWGCDQNPTAVSENYLEFGVADPPAFGPKVGHEYVGPYACFPINSTSPSSSYNTIAAELDNAGVTWRYYVQPRSADDSFWLNAFDAVRAIRYGPDWTNGDISSPDTNVLTDIANNDLQQVSWVMPHKGASDHPGGAAGNCGPDWVASIVNAVGQSQYWNNTAIIIMWDEWGGWYDHVLPKQYEDPVTHAYEGLGYRVPLLIVSPYAKKGFISHKQHEIASTLHLIEQTFSLLPLGTGTPYHLADERADAFDDAFNFTQKPRPFKAIQLVNEPPVKSQLPCPMSSKDLVSKTWGPEIDY